MNDVNLTLYRTGTTVNIYEIQFNAVFDEPNYKVSNYQIVSTPQARGGTLAINLHVSTGSDSHIVHDVVIGEFPNSIPNWVLDVQYVDENGIIKKKVKTEQAQGESEPRPVEQSRL